MENFSYTISMGEEGLRFQYVLYSEDNKTLRLFLETSGDSLNSDLLGTRKQFEKWTEPSDLPISLEKQVEIVQRVKEWGLGHNLRIDISKGITFEEDSQQMIREGWTLTKNLDGTVTCVPPKRSEIE